MRPELPGASLRQAHIPVRLARHASGRRDESDKLHGFRLGADDYVVRPFSILELIGSSLFVHEDGGAAQAISRAAAFTSAILWLDVVSSAPGLLSVVLARQTGALLPSLPAGLDAAAASLSSRLSAAALLTAAFLRHDRRLSQSAR